MSTSPGPLAGLRVLELGTLVAGPFGGQLLGDYGAEIIKVEAPAGDPLRRWGVLSDGESLWWTSIARNKRSVVVDLTTDAGAAVVRRLAVAADVVLQNFRPGQLERWGLRYEDLAAENPGLIMVHVSGYGRTGPRAPEAGFGSIGEAMGGIRHTTGEPGRASSRTGISLGDSLAAMFAVIGTLAAVHERSRSGTGQEVDVALYEAVAALMESSMADAEVSGGGARAQRRDPPRSGTVERVPHGRRQRGAHRRQRRPGVRTAVRGDGRAGPDRRSPVRGPPVARGECDRARRGHLRLDGGPHRRRCPRRPGRPRGAVRSRLHRRRCLAATSSTWRGTWCCGRPRPAVGTCRCRGSSPGSPAPRVRCRARPPARRRHRCRPRDGGGTGAGARSRPSGPIRSCSDRAVWPPSAACRRGRPRTRSRPPPSAAGRVPAARARRSGGRPAPARRPRRPRR